MATVLLIAGTNVLPSSEFTLAQGQTTTLAMTPLNLTADMRLDVEYKLADGNWATFGSMTVFNRGIAITTPGTWRVERAVATVLPYGCDRD